MVKELSKSNQNALEYIAYTVLKLLKFLNKATFNFFTYLLKAQENI